MSSYDGAKAALAGYDERLRVATASLASGLVAATVSTLTLVALGVASPERTASASKPSCSTATETTRRTMGSSSTIRTLRGPTSGSIGQRACEPDVP